MQETPEWWESSLPREACGYESRQDFFAGRGRRRVFQAEHAMFWQTFLRWQEQQSSRVASEYSGSRHDLASADMRRKGVLQVGLKLESFEGLFTGLLVTRVPRSLCGITAQGLSLCACVCACDWCGEGGSRILLSRLP